MSIMPPRLYSNFIVGNEGRKTQFGGEEILWLMQCKSVDEAEQSALRLVTTIRTTPISIAGVQPITLTVTLGLAQVGDEEELSSAIKRSDVALYEGKNAGRDRFVIAKL